jgi:hypoxanthine phosphoribosyltransferase
MEREQIRQRVRVKDRHFSIYLSDHEIQGRIGVMAQLIETQLSSQNPLFIGILNGSFMFAADLCRQFSFPCTISFVKVASYQGTQSSGQVSTLIALNENIQGRHVVLIEDIIDTGLTIQSLLNELAAKKPASIRIATLLFKKVCLKVPVHPDFIGFEVPDKFLVGYGLDYDGYGRNFPHVYAEEPAG